MSERWMKRIKYYSHARFMAHPATDDRFYLDVGVSRVIIA